MTNDIHELLAWLEGAPVPDAQSVAAAFNHTFDLTATRARTFLWRSARFRIMVRGDRWLSQWDRPLDRSCNALPPLRERARHPTERRNDVG